jgi:hypothetical protein
VTEQEKKSLKGEKEIYFIIPLLGSDVGETTNLVSQNPRLARRLAKKVCAWYEANRQSIILPSQNN